MVKKALFSPGDLCGGTYEITDTLGEDPFAETYTATHRRTRAAAEITCSRFDHIDGDAPSIEAFKASAERLQKLAIDSVPRIYDYGVDEGVYWIASQVLDDPTILEVHARMAGKPGSWFVEDALSAMLCIVPTLSAASASGVVHGNLRPDLIVLRGLPNSCDPHLLELGFADLFMLTREAARTEPRYRSPEQLEGAPVDARSDIYALGMCLYELIAKAPPYADKAPASGSVALLEMALRELPTPLPALVTYCPDYVWRMIAKAIDKDPQKRFQTHGEFREAINAVLDQLMAVHDPVNLADLGAQGRDLLEAFRAYQEAHGAAKGEATGTTDTPRTLPPGVDTTRRVRAALAEARASIEEGAAPRVAVIAPPVPPVAQPAPQVTSDRGGEESAPLTETAPGSLSAGPTPRLPVDPAPVREAIPVEALPAVASAPAVAPIAAPETVRVVAPLVASVVMPTPPAIRRPNATSSEPSASTRVEGAMSKRPILRHIRWAAPLSVALFIGFVGLCPVPMLGGHNPDNHSDVESARHWLVDSQRGTDRDVAQPRSFDPAPPVGRADPKPGKGQRPSPRSTHTVVEWFASGRAVKKTWRSEKE